MKHVINTILFVAFIISGFILYKYTMYTVLTDREEDSIETCEFVIRSNSPTFNITEHTKGSYQYTVYARPDGFIEVWKCP